MHWRQRRDEIHLPADPIYYVTSLTQLPEASSRPALHSWLADYLSRSLVDSVNRSRYKLINDLPSTLPLVDHSRNLAHEEGASVVHHLRNC
jgi:hypothetical protein